MLRLQLKKVTLRIDLLMLLFPALAVLLGSDLEVGCLMLALIVHECAHFIAARLLNVGMSSVRLTPFGGIAQIENPYSVPPSKLFAVAGAGPAANLLLMLIASAMGQRLPVSPAFAATLIQINAMLMLFNLLPALPLDGGRMLYTLLSTRLRRERALNIGIWLGRLVAASLAALSIWGLIVRHRLNLSPLFAAIFLICAAADERQALLDSRVQTLINGLRSMKVPIPVQLVAIDASTTLVSAISVARPDRLTLFAVYKDGKLNHFTDDRTLLAHMSKSDVLP